MQIVPAPPRSQSRTAIRSCACRRARGSNPARPPLMLRPVALLGHALQPFVTALEARSRRRCLILALYHPIGRFRLTPILPHCRWSRLPLTPYLSDCFISSGPSPQPHAGDADFACPLSLVARAQPRRPLPVHFSRPAQNRRNTLVIHFPHQAIGGQQVQVTRRKPQTRSRPRRPHPGCLLPG